MKKTITATLLCFSLYLSAQAQTSHEPIIVRESAKENSTEKKSSLSELIGLKGLTAPQFALPAMNGTEYNLENLRGKIVVINLWGTFCPPCITEMPHLNELVKKYKDQNVVFLAPAPDDKASLEKFLQANPFDYQVLPNAMSVVKNYAPHKKAVEGAKTDGGYMMILPTHLVIDQTGAVVFHEWGFSQEMTGKLSREIDKLLSKKS